MHEFYEWQQDYNDYSRHCRERGLKNTHKNLEEFQVWRENYLAQLYKRGDKQAVIRHDAEKVWRKAGCPFYNVHPELVTKLCRIDLDKIPAHLVEMPQQLEGVNIRFAKQHPEMTLTDDQPAPKSYPGYHNPLRVKRGDFVHSLLMVKPTERMVENFRWEEVGSPVKKHMGFLFCLDFGVIDTSEGHRVFMTVPLAWADDGETLKYSLFDLAQHTNNASPGFVRLAANCMKLAVTIGFLANSENDLIEPDVLSKDRFEFDKTEDETRRKFIADRAKRRGKLGWNVGNDMMFLGEVAGKARASGIEQGGTRQLKWSHIRTGHPHAVRYGKGHKMVKIMWFRPTTVRDDLPFKNE